MRCGISHSLLVCTCRTVLCFSPDLDSGMQPLGMSKKTHDMPLFTIDRSPTGNPSCRASRYEDKIDVGFLRARTLGPDSRPSGSLHCGARLSCLRDVGYCFMAFRLLATDDSVLPRGCCGSGCSYIPCGTGPSDTKLSIGDGHRDAITRGNTRDYCTLWKTLDLHWCAFKRVQWRVNLVILLILLDIGALFARRNFGLPSKSILIIYTPRINLSRTCQCQCTHPANGDSHDADCIGEEERLQTGSLDKLRIPLRAQPQLRTPASAKLVYLDVCGWSVINHGLNFCSFPGY